MRDNLKHRDDAPVEGVKEAASALIEDVEKLGKVTRVMASDSMGRVQKNISQIYKKGQGEFQKVEGQLEAYIQEHPLRTVMIAAGAGFLFGLIRKKI